MFETPRQDPVTFELRDQLQTVLGTAYDIERELGGGGMSRVFVAVERAFGRRVVLKVLHPEVAEAVSVERFRRETQLAARLQHPHIVPLFGGGEAGGFLYYTMPLIEGESLRARLASKGALPVDDAVRLAREAADALAYAHARGVVHRDIKPDNILLSDGHALVTDFGIAHAVDSDSSERLTSIGLVVGTPAYMSPEQASGETEIDGRSDIYSLGCVLYEMLVGEPPFSGPTVQALISRRFTDRVPHIRDKRPALPADVDATTAKAMATISTDRFPTAREFASALGATPTPVDPTPRRRAPNARVWAGVATVLAVGLGLWGVARARGISPAGGPPTRTTADATDQSPSVAVLYFRNETGDTTDAYLVDGISEEITAGLGRFSQFRVKSRGAAGRLRTAGITDASQAGRMLAAQFVLTGAVRRQRDRIQASVELVRADDESRAWGANYDLPRDSVTTLRDSVVAQVAANVGGATSASERPAIARMTRVNPEAHDHYLRGTFQLAKRNPRSVATAIDEFEGARRIDPRMTSALARAGYAYAVFADWGWPHPRGLTSDILLQHGLDAADAALREDSASAEAWLARAYLLFLKHPRTLDSVTVAFERAVRLDSTNAETQYQYGQALMASGNAAGAVGRYRRSIALEPDWASPLMSLGSLVARSGNYDEGLKWLDSAVAVDPSSSYSFAARATTRAAAGRQALALADAQSAVRVAMGYRVPPYAAMAVALALGGDTTTARRWADSTVRLVPDTSQLSPTDALYVSAALIRTGQVERGLGMLEHARPAGAWLWFYMTSPLFDRVRTHPRFVRVSERAKPPGV
jgi:serine/threonine-protein kinase